MEQNAPCFSPHILWIWIILPMYHDFLGPRGLQGTHMDTLKPKNSKSITFTVRGGFFTFWAILAHHTDLKWQIWRNNCFNGKTCKFDSDISDFNSVDLKKTKKIIKGQIFFQRPNLKAKGQKFQILWFFQWFGLVCKQLFRKSHWFKWKGHKGR